MEAGWSKVRVKTGFGQGPRPLTSGGRRPLTRLEAGVDAIREDACDDSGNWRCEHAVRKVCLK